MPDDERPEDEAPATAGEPADESAGDAEPAPTLSPRRAPLRGSGSGFGMAGEGGGMGRLLRRVQEAAEIARRTAEERRPAAERAVREAAERAKQAAESAKPEAERLARQARAAAEAARPHLERAAGNAAQFAREHEDDLRSAAAQAARNAAPPSLRPALDAMQSEMTKHPSEGQPAHDRSGAGDDAVDAEQATEPGEPPPRP